MAYALTGKTIADTYVYLLRINQQDSTLGEFNSAPYGVCSGAGGAWPLWANKEIIAIDGKTLRGSRNNNSGLKPIHLVSAWASKAGVMLAQVKTKEKSNEIEAIPRLLDLIDVENSIVTIDAMGCQKKIAEKITDKNAE